MERAEIPGVILTLNPGAADHPKPRIWMRAQVKATVMSTPTSTTITTLGRNRARHAGQRPVLFGWTTPQAGQDIIFTIVISSRRERLRTESARIEIGRGCLIRQRGIGSRPISPSQQLVCLDPILIGSATENVPQNRTGPFRLTWNMTRRPAIDQPGRINPSQRHVSCDPTIVGAASKGGVRKSVRHEKTGRLGANVRRLDVGRAFLPERENVGLESPTYDDLGLRYRPVTVSALCRAADG
jgi:hypothetical protein